MIRVLLLVACTLLFLIPSTALASTKFCIQADTSFVDNGYSDDYWPTDIERHLRGARAIVTKSGLTLFDGFLGDDLGSGNPGLGCTSTMYPGIQDGTYTITVTTRASVNSNTLELYEYEYPLSPASTEYVVTANYAHSLGSGTFDVTIPITANTETLRAFNVFNAATYALWRHNGGESGNTFVVLYDESDTADNFYDSGSSGRVVIDRSGSDNKFMIAHELGHRLAHVTVGDKLVGVSEGAAEGSCPTEGSGYHSMRSMEWQEATAAEGFAHFFAADVWNDHYEDDCFFRYYKNTAGAIRTVDCESADLTYFPLAYIESVPCASINGMKGMGVELDWLRTFWDMHTNGTLSFNDKTSTSSWMTKPH